MSEDKLACSVVITVYNAEKFIEQTVRSVMNQTVKNIEIICVNDCSKDNSVEIIKRLMTEDSRIVLLENDTNLKVSQTRNKGIQYSHANWIALLDSDDMWEPEFLERVIARRDETGGRVIHTSYRFMAHDGKILDSTFIVDDSITYKQLFKQNKILPSASFIEKSLLLKYPFYADNVHEDFVCWLSILKEINVAYGVKEPSMLYRLTEGSKSRNKFKAIKMSYNTYKAHGVPFFKRWYYTFCNAINGLKKYSKIKK
ncbi:MAG: glycosyltransferase family 2 protein [Clostridiales bacterium]|nr:glycosyltransferase family 2 protein [Clostridiales bacterium]